MGSSKIIFVGAVAVVIGMFGFGIKRAERASAEIAETHLYQVKAKTLALLGLEASIRRLPRTDSDSPVYDSVSTNEGPSFVSFYKYSTSSYTTTTPQVIVTAYGVVNNQQVQFQAILQFVTPPAEPYSKPSGTMWNGWTGSTAKCLKLLSLKRTYSTWP